MQPENRFGLLQSEDENSKPIEEVGLGREVPEKQKRPLSGEASPAHCRSGWGEDSSEPDEKSEEVDPRDAVGAGNRQVHVRGPAREHAPCSYEQPPDQAPAATHPTADPGAAARRGGRHRDATAVQRQPLAPVFDSLPGPDSPASKRYPD